RRASVAYANGTQTGYAYDAQQRLSGLSHDFAGSAQDVGYGFSYNEAGEIRSRSVGNAAYETLSPGSIQRTYRPAAGSSATGGNGLNQYGRIDPAPSTFSYDTNGNLTQDADPLRVWTYAYDSERRLTAANDTTFAYDAVGRLAEVRTGSASRRFLYDGVDRIGEYDATSGALLGRIVHGPAVDEPLVVYEGAARTWLYGDERGSVVAHAGDSGAVGQINTYGVFGEPGPANAGRFGFTGQAHLADTGLYHYKARVYAPALGRFLQPDPIGEAGGINLYAYGLNDPVNLTDPDGLQAIQLPPIYVYTSPPVPSGGGIPPTQIAQQTVNSAIGSALRGTSVQSVCAFFCTMLGGPVETSFGTYNHQMFGFGMEASSYAAAGIQLSVPGPEDYVLAAAGLGIALRGGTTAVYRSLNAAGDVQYAGITNNLARRAAEHLRGSGIQVEKLIGGLSRSDARSVEQALIEIHGLGKNGGTLLNRINSISRSNPAYANQLRRGYELLQTVGY
ncbi:MAG: RHS repeat-associated core domain-containing protein, partial [Hyphomicrobium sp.]